MKIQHVMTLINANLESILFSGIIFGWPALQLVLEEEGYFQDRCENSTSKFPNSTESTTSQQSCMRRESSFNLVFTLTTALMFLLIFPLGYILDHFGTWIFRCILTSIFTLGNVMLIISSASLSNFVYPAIIFLGVSGLGLLLGNLPLVNLASRGRGTLATLMDGMFDSSPLVFFLIKKSYEFGIGLHTIFQFLTCLSIIPWLTTFVLLPRKSIPIPAPKNLRYGWKEWPCFKKKDDIQENHNVGECATANCTNENSTSGKTFKDCLRSKLLWTNTFHFAVITFRVNFFLGSLIAWLKGFRNKNEISSLADVLIVLILFSAFAAPLNGLLVDTVIKFSKSRITNKQALNLTGLFFSMLATSFLSILLSIMAVIPNAYASFAFFFITKTFVYGGFSTFLLFQFPVQHFGKLYGLANLISGAIGFLQFALFELALAVDPTFEYIHIGLLVFTILTLVHPLAIYLKAQKLTKDAERQHTVIE